MKILGCCLETKIPILVYEYPVNKNLSNLLDEKSVTKENRPPILSWESKLRIATEIADAVTYMHIATSTPIIHRDIKSCNIFLGEQNVIKLFGFDLSLKITSGEEDVETNMSRTIGTIGYIAPECMSGQPITEKCDVYGFGITLIEILTEMTPWAFRRWLRLEDSSNVVSEAGGSDLYFSKEQVFEVSLKRNILGEGEIKQVMACITLAWECKKDNPTERPSMKCRRMLSQRQSRRERHLQKESLVSRNGAILLEEVIKSVGRKYNPYHIFSEKDLEIATNCYRSDHILQNGGFYVLYRGIHEYCKILVKKFSDRSINNNISRIIEDFVISLQIRNHKNVLTILGCCLETEFPILVYEYSSKKTLSNLLHDVTVGNFTNRPSALSWESKLRIATEIADAVTYMHISTSTPIIHRDIKPRSILLDGRNVVKLFDFDLSLKIPLGEDNVKPNMIVGTSGYLAPEYSMGQPITEKCDVYGFGALLVEILTEMKPREFKLLRDLDLADEEGSSSVGKLDNAGKVPVLSRETLDQNEDDSTPSEFSRFFSLARANDLYSKKRILEVSLKRNKLGEGQIKQLMECTLLALECIKYNPKKRPSMKEVTEELRRIKTMTC
ncbi:hypothetical protein GIB67_033061 [Kingdonia uniflora]|uniref:Protein kinase domain-containing protein n=1 Tax=Kingdonia uniflora TaxID=39325 RepID=A0A7J7MYQ8_9MAGN|nr:hypothetical protein GIB67_033061 [Kingdonia uniflora]